MNVDRIEDCLAKDEQIKRLRAEVTAADARAEEWSAKAKSSHKRLLAYLSGAFVSILAVHLLLSLDASKSAQKYPCYFVDTESGNPWDRWRVVKDTRYPIDSGRLSVATQQSFSSRNEAWDFLVKWKVEVCK